MEALCLDILNSDWHDWHGSGRDEDRLLKEGWLEQILERWHLKVSGAIDGQNIALVREVRTVMQQVLGQILEAEYMRQWLRSATPEQLARLGNWACCAQGSLHQLINPLSPACLCSMTMCWLEPGEANP